jgi:hypothetical protein
LTYARAKQIKTMPMAIFFKVESGASQSTEHNKECSEASFGKSKK